MTPLQFHVDVVAVALVATSIVSILLVLLRDARRGRDTALGLHDGPRALAAAALRGEGTARDRLPSPVEDAERAAATLLSSWAATLADHEYSPPIGDCEGEQCHGDRPGCTHCERVQTKARYDAEAAGAAVAALRAGRTFLAVQHAARIRDPHWNHDEGDAFLRAVLAAAFAPDVATSAWERIAAHPNALFPCDVHDLVTLALGEAPSHPWPLEDLDEGCAGPFSSLPIYDEVAWDTPMHRELLDWHAAIESAAVELLRRGEYRVAHSLLAAASRAHPSCPSVRGFANTMFWADRIDALGLTARRYGPGLALFAPRLARFHVELEAIVRKGLAPPGRGAPTVLP
jgi:hypothetical protein